MSNGKRNLLNLFKFIIGWPISVIALFFIFKVIFSKFDEVKEYIKTPTITLLIYGIICFVLFYLIRGYFWKKLLEEKGHNLDFKEVSFLWGVSELKRFAPGNVWSFLGRTFSFSEIGVDKKTIALLFITEAQFFLLGCFVLSIFSLQFIFPYVFSIRTYSHFIIPFASIIVSLFTILFIFNRFFLKKLRINFLNNFLPDFNPHTNFVFLLISILYLSFFGLGTFLTIASVVYLPVNLFLQLVSFFIFSLLIGYFSLLTPMGLGVREAVISFGLLKFMSLEIAGFASILARLILIISELISLLIIVLWIKLKNETFLKIENYIRNHLHVVILAILIAIYILYFTTASLLRYDNFFTGRFDLGNMDQTVWNTIHGRIFMMTDPNGTDIISRLSFHSDFLLILISPLYLIWSNPKILLLVQSITLGLGAFFVYLISKKILNNKNISLVLAFSYLINPSVQFSNLYDFHPVTLATTLLLAAFYFLINKKYLWMIIFLILASLSKEQVWINSALFGFYIFIKDKKKLLGSLISIISFGIFYYLVTSAIPQARGSQHFALSYYSEFGDSPISIIKNMIFSPIKTLQIIFGETQLKYLLNIFSPLGFLSLLFPLTLVFALPDFFIDLLSSNSQLRDIYYQYTATITPFVFISAVYAINLLRQKIGKININYFVWYILFTALFGAYFIGPMPGSKNPNISIFTNQLSQKEIIDNYLKSIPAKYSISATNNLGSHLSRRQKIFTVPLGIDKADIILFLLNDSYAQPSLMEQKEIAEKMKKDKKYIQVFKEGEFIVFEKRTLYLEENEKKIQQVKLFPLSIPSLAHRDYQKGEIKIERKLESNNFFTSYIAYYQSDGLKIFTLLNIPNITMPDNGFPVVIINHGYINPSDYNTVTSYKTASDYFSKNGYLVLKPDYRGNGNSEIDNKALMRFAYPIDIMNLISSLPSIKEADASSIYLWSHSMGGEITLKVLEIAGKDAEFSQKIKAAILWAPVTDPLKWFSRRNIPRLEEAVTTPFPYSRTFEILGRPEDNPKLWESLSPLTYLKDIPAPILISHGTSDQSVPYEWSVELYNSLLSFGKNVEFKMYSNADHNLNSVSQTAYTDSLSFISSY